MLPLCQTAESLIQQGFWPVSSLLVTDVTFFLTPAMTLKNSRPTRVRARMREVSFVHEKSPDRSGLLRC